MKPSLHNRCSGRALATLLPCVEFGFNFAIFQTGVDETLQQPTVWTEKVHLTHIPQDKDTEIFHLCRA